MRNLFGYRPPVRVPLKFWAQKNLCDYSEEPDNEADGAMIARGEPSNTQTWSATLPPTSRQRWSVLVVAAILLIALERWRRSPTQLFNDLPRLFH